MSKEQVDTKNCKECLHFEACCKWTDFPKQIGFPTCRNYRKQEWISVEERLPDPNEYDWVLVNVAFNEDGSYGVPMVAECRNGEWWNSDDRLTELFLTVTHWMPLPEPPKGGEG